MSRRVSKVPRDRLKLLDYFFLLLSVALTLGTFLGTMTETQKGGPLLVQIQAQGGTFLYPLSEDRDVSVPGPAGTTLIRIEKGQAFAVNSPGAQRIIMLMGKIDKSGQWIASLPNRVFVRIVGGGEPDVDAGVF